MKTTKSRIIFFAIAITYNLLLGLYLKDFLVLSQTLTAFYLLSVFPTFFLLIEARSRVMKAIVYIVLALDILMYRYGECVEKDEKMAYTLYKKAHSVHLYFEEVFADILVRLGECELYGIGTRKDVISAVKRFTLAEGYLYEKIHTKKDPFAHEVLAKVKGLIQTAEGMLQGG